MFILSAISDGILHNDALKQNGDETKNETWNRLLQDLKFFPGEDDHIMYLRRRFVLGASEFMCGANGSKQNDKDLFEFTDDEWEYIWVTMLEDGAWAVPSIKDKDGKTVKANWAPEILIKFIVHEVKCHIIVFDLLLNTVQFISGNHIRSDNVVFASPLLIYATGGHFQSVFQTDHEYFINYARELDAENESKIAPMSKIFEHLENGVKEPKQDNNECTSTSRQSELVKRAKPDLNSSFEPPEKNLTWIRMQMQILNI